MKRILVLVLLILAGLGHTLSFAQTVMATANGSFHVPDIFTLEFYDREPDKYLYTDRIPFTNMDPTQTWVMADRRRTGDGKNDLGLLCKTNLGQRWYLKIQGRPNDFFLSKIQYGFWQPWNLSLAQSSNGSLSEGWQALTANPTTIYTAGSNDLFNLGLEGQEGTLCGFSFAIDPSKLDPSRVHQCTIQFTLTTNM